MTTKENSSYSWKEKGVLLTILSIFLLYLCNIKSIFMEKRIIKAIIAERQQEISKIQLVERPISLLGMKKGQFQGMSWI